MQPRFVPPRFPHVPLGLSTRDLVALGLAILLGIPLGMLISTGWLQHRAPQPARLEVRVFIPGAGIVSMDLERYLVGVVAAEMPASFPVEALKAQAVAARTRTLHQMVALGGSGCALHPGADVCTDPNHDQAWISEDQFRARVGLLAYVRLWPRLVQAVEATSGQALFFHGKLIDAVYHSASGGQTENSEDVWSEYVPYLRSVQSPWEAGVPPPYSREVREFTVSELEQKLGVRVNLRLVRDQAPLFAWQRDEAARWAAANGGIAVLARSRTGRVMEIAVGSRRLKGSELRNLLGLRSTLLHLQIRPAAAGTSRGGLGSRAGTGAGTDRAAGAVLVVETRGYGHGVGLSQWGAAGMARAGFNYRQILQYYYSGTLVQEVSVGSPAPSPASPRAPGLSSAPHPYPSVIK